jgi:hypothetical protein
MKVLTRSRYGAAQTALGGRDPIASGLPRLQSRQAIPHGTSGQYLIALLQGWAKRSVPTCQV